VSPSRCSRETEGAKIWFVRRAQDKAGKAVELITRALVISEKLKDDDLKASMLCNLGTTLMQVWKCRNGVKETGGCPRGAVHPTHIKPMQPRA